MNKLKISIITLFMFTFPQVIYAQETTNNNENATILHQNGQIYLVVLVLVTIFTGIIFYLIRLEKKINKLEKKANG